jgi:hypothetical protein
LSLFSYFLTLAFCLNIKVFIFHGSYTGLGLDLWCLTPLSAIVQFILCLVVLLFCLSIDLRLPITPSNLFTIGVSVHRVTASDYPFQFVYHWSVCPSSYGFRLPLPICLPLECLSFDYPFQFVYHWSVCPSITPSNLFTIGVSVHRVTASHYLFDISC